VLALRLSTIRLFVHVLAATVWVGGQLVLAGLVPGARQLDPSLPRALARRFAAISWPAFAVLVVTGIWNIAAVHATFSGAYGTTLTVKIAVVALSGLTAFLHSRSRSKAGLAVFGALAGLSAIGALLLGIQLHG
jgi:putative copper export protein